MITSSFLAGESSWYGGGSATISPLIDPLDIAPDSIILTTSSYMLAFARTWEIGAVFSHIGEMTDTTTTSTMQSNNDSSTAAKIDLLGRLIFMSEVDTVTSPWLYWLLLHEHGYCVQREPA